MIYVHNATMSTNSMEHFKCQWTETNIKKKTTMEHSNTNNK